MEKKKTINLESKRKLFFSLGLFIVSAGVLCAFTYKTPLYLKYNILAIEQEADVPLLLVENDVRPEKVEAPVVEKLPVTIPSTQIFDNELLNNITITGNNNSTPTITLTGKSIPTLTFDPDLGTAPVMEEIVKYPDREAKFIGSWPKFLQNGIVYPEIDIERGESGTVFVNFVVERDGSLSSVKVLNKDKVSKTLQNEAVRVVKSSPNWKPGINNGEMVRTYMTVKINFILGG